jgi:hypothetical protein
MTSVTIGKYCVYHHLKNGEVFYVGKGNPSRPFHFASRNEKWKSIAGDGFGIEVKIVRWYPSSQAAFLAEQADIIKLRPVANLFQRKRKP